MASRRIDKTLTAEQLRAVLNYEPTTGIFRWKHRADVSDQINKKFAGTVAGWISRQETGHMKITLNGASYFLHRLAWLYQTGAMPAFEIDHIDGNPGNNAWTNLRDVTHRQNSRNTKPRKTILDELPRLKGARFHRTTGRWQASIIVDGKSHYLGLFPTQRLAHSAYCEAAVRLHGECARFE
jgi:hypothetical protein